MKVFTLCKDERLYLREAISELFAKGSSFTIYPYRVVYRVLPESDSQAARCAIITIASKKKFRHAVDRNRVKRLTREAYRLNKLQLLANLETKGKKLQAAFIYLKSEHITFVETESVMKKVLQKLTRLA